MNRGQSFRVGAIAAFFTVVLVAGALLAFYFFTEHRIDYSAIDHIKELQMGPNHFSDISGDICVNSADDVGFEVKGDYNLIVYYGKQVIKIPPEAFQSQEFRDALGKIGIKLYYRVGDDGTIMYKVTYWDEPIDQYSLVR